jgi:hypothetical protein
MPVNTGQCRRRLSRNRVFRRCVLMAQAVTLWRGDSQKRTMATADTWRGFQDRVWAVCAGAQAAQFAASVVPIFARFRQPATQAAMPSRNCSTLGRWRRRTGAGRHMNRYADILDRAHDRLITFGPRSHNPCCLWPKQRRRGRFTVILYSWLASILNACLISIGYPLTDWAVGNVAEYAIAK